MDECLSCVDKTGGVTFNNSPSRMFSSDQVTMDTSSPIQVKTLFRNLSGNNDVRFGTVDRSKIFRLSKYGQIDS